MRRALLFGVVLSWSLRAGAQPQNAEALFDKGVEALEAGKFPEACPMLAESQRLEPRPGTLFTLADCEAKWGKSAQSVEHYEEYLRQVEALPAPQKSKHTARQQKATELLSKLNPKVGRVTLNGAPAGAEVTLDDRKLTPEALSKPLVVEPGAHRALLRSAGAEKATSFSVQAGESKQVTLETAAAPPPPPPTASASALPPAAPEKPSGPTRLPPAAFYAAAGVGVAGLAVGAIGGLVALSKKKTVDKECVGLVCSQAGFDALDSGRTAATASTVGFVVGLIGAGAAAGLWVTGVSSPTRSALRATPVVGSGNLGLSVGGRW